MKTILQIKLVPTPEQGDALLQTMHRVNAACNAIAAIAFQLQCASKFELQKQVYHDIKDRFGLSAQMTILAVRKVVEVYKRDKTKQPVFKPTGAIIYDQRIMSFKGVTHVSLWTLAGRLTIPIMFGAYQQARWHQKKGQADLVLRRGVFYLLVTVDAPEQPVYSPDGMIGVDLGVVKLATDSDGQSFSGQTVEAARQRFATLRRDLQRCGSKSAKRHLRKMRRREALFRKHENHCMSKQIVEKAKRTRRGIALEELTGIRDRNRVRKSQRSALHVRSFLQLRTFIQYKATLAGVPVVMVDPRYTSQTCFVCGHRAKTNRPSQARFVCQACGHTDNADANAAKNIAARAVVNQPIVGNDDGQAAEAELRLS